MARFLDHIVPDVLEDISQDAVSAGPQHEHLAKLRSHPVSGGQLSVSPVTASCRSQVQDTWDRTIIELDLNLLDRNSFRLNYHWDRCNCSTSTLALYCSFPCLAWDRAINIIQGILFHGSSCRARVARRPNNKQISTEIISAEIINIHTSQSGRPWWWASPPSPTHSSWWGW